MNIYSLIQDCITQISPNSAATVKIFNGTTVGYGGEVVADYTDTVIDNVQVQLENNQELEHKFYYQINKIYKAFYMSTNVLTGLSRQLQTNGDYIVHKNVSYKIVEVIDDFNSGYICVIGCAGNSADAP